MNDRFKFRVYDPVKKTYYYDDFYIMCDGTGAIYTPLEEGEDENRLIIEQCTGLKDKNGRLAYENDIVVFPEMGSKCEYRIVWSDLICGFGFKCNEDSIVQISLETMKRSEIIGNVHENEELLK